MVFRRGARSTWYVQVPTRTGWVQRSTETRDRMTAVDMEAMLQRIGPRGRREWDLLDAIESCRLTLAQVYDAYRVEKLDDLRARLDDVDLRSHLAGWQTWLADRVKPDTADHYVLHLMAFLPAVGPALRSQFTRPRLAATLASLPVSGSTKRKYLAAVSSFAAYLMQLDVLETNPARDVIAPAAPSPIPIEIDLADVVRIVQGARQPYRSVLALLYGAGVEVSAALALRRRYVDVAHQEVRAPGTKAYNRDRVVIVSEWAWPFFAEALDRKLPGAPLFPRLDRWRVGKYHRTLLADLEIDHHKLHAARNFWAIRAIKAGWPIEAVVRQLGHRDAGMLMRVYGRFIPRQAERRHWETLATAQDAVQLKAAGAIRGAGGYTFSNPNPGSRGFND